jgi:hypothetical protein
MGNIVWMSAADGSWGGCDKGDLIIVDTDEFSDEDFDALNEAENEGDVYQILMKYVRLNKHSHIVTPG